MKRILIIQESLNGGGAENVLTELINNIDYNRVDVTLLLINYNGIYTKLINSKIKKLYIYKHQRPLFKRILAHTTLIDCIEKQEIKKIIKEKEFDVIISFMEGITLKYHSYIVTHAPLNITWIHSNLIINSWTSKVFQCYEKELKCYNLMDKIIFVSEQAKESFNRKFQTACTNQYVLYNIINKNKIQLLSNKESINKRKFTICNVARLAAIKKQDRLIKAIKILIDKGCDIELWILGTGNEFHKLKKLVSELSLTEIVQFKGFQTNPYPYIKASDVFVLSSDTEGYPTVICEALCLGKPIVSTKITGCTELLGDNEYGILTELSEQAIADAIYELYNSKEKILWLQQKAIERSKCFSIENTINEFYNVIGV